MAKMIRTESHGYISPGDIMSLDVVADGLNWSIVGELVGDYNDREFLHVVFKRLGSVKGMDETVARWALDEFYKSEIAPE